MPLAYDFPTAKAPLRSAGGHRVLRIGHGGATAYAPQNSLRSLQTALDQGVDMVEFDVRGCADGLVLAHDDEVTADSGPVTLSQLPLAQVRQMAVEGEPIVAFDDALELIKGRALINVDMKDQGHEKEVAAAVLRHRLVDRVLASSLYPASLRRLREALPGVTTGISYPEDKAGVSGNPHMAPLVDVALWAMRQFVLVTMGRKLAQSSADNVMLYRRVVTPGAVRSFHSAGVRVFVWTVDDLALMKKLVAMEVDGITTNRPDLFDELA